VIVQRKISREKGKPEKKNKKGDSHTFILAWAVWLLLAGFSLAAANAAVGIGGTLTASGDAGWVSSGCASKPAGTAGKKNAFVAEVPPVGLLGVLTGGGCAALHREPFAFGVVVVVVDVDVEDVMVADADADADATTASTLNKGQRLKTE
jgi:hypothetical protein